MFLKKFREMSSACPNMSCQCRREMDLPWMAATTSRRQSGTCLGQTKHNSVVRMLQWTPTTSRPRQCHIPLLPSLKAHPELHMAITWPMRCGIGTMHTVRTWEKDSNLHKHMDTSTKHLLHKVKCLYPWQQFGDNPLRSHPVSHSCQYQWTKLHTSILRGTYRVSLDRAVLLPGSPRISGGQCQYLRVRIGPRLPTMSGNLLNTVVMLLTVRRRHGESMLIRKDRVLPLDRYPLASHSRPNDRTSQDHRVRIRLPNIWLNRRGDHTVSLSRSTFSS